MILVLVQCILSTAMIEVSSLIFTGRIIQPSDYCNSSNGSQVKFTTAGTTLNIWILYFKEYVDLQQLQILWTTSQQRRVELFQRSDKFYTLYFTKIPKDSSANVETMY